MRDILFGAFVVVYIIFVGILISNQIVSHNQAALAHVTQNSISFPDYLKVDHIKVGADGSYEAWGHVTVPTK